MMINRTPPARQIAERTKFKIQPFDHINVILLVEIILNGKTLQEVQNGFEMRHEFVLFDSSLHALGLMTLPTMTRFVAGIEYPQTIEPPFCGIK